MCEAAVCEAAAVTGWGARLRGWAGLGWATEIDGGASGWFAGGGETRPSARGA